uniref:Uncharacterized protein n=1 Tax=Anguilla anguilla TaxID=7936 RepID=A0A0E9WAC2_ANGAN
MPYGVVCGCTYTVQHRLPCNDMISHHIRQASSVCGTVCLSTARHFKVDYTEK